MGIIEVMWLFLTYGFIGWLWETPYVSVCEKRWINRGFLRGPFIPIYGFGATTIVLFMNFFETHVQLAPPLDVLVGMFFAMVVATVLEYVTSYLMEVAFSTRWWDYSSRKFNINGRIALLPSLFWGVGGYTLWRYVNPTIEGLVDTLFGPYKMAALIFFYGVLVIDTVSTVGELVSLRKVLTRTRALSDKFSEFIEENEGLKEWVDEAKSTLKANSVYKRLEGFKELNDFTEFIKSKTQELQGKNLEEITKVMSKLKKHNRFARKYPNARTKKMPDIFFSIRKKDREKNPDDQS